MVISPVALCGVVLATTVGKFVTCLCVNTRKGMIIISHYITLSVMHIMPASMGECILVIAYGKSSAALIPYCLALHSHRNFLIAMDQDTVIFAWDLTWIITTVGGWVELFVELHLGAILDWSFCQLLLELKCLKDRSEGTCPSLTQLPPKQPSMSPIILPTSSPLMSPTKSPSKRSSKKDKSAKKK